MSFKFKKGERDLIIEEIERLDCDASLKRSLCKFAFTAFKRINYFNEEERNDKNKRQKN